MNFEPGKYYKTTNGIKVLCVGRGLPGRYCHVFAYDEDTFATADEDGNAEPGTMDAGGKWIVGEWKEPIVVELEVVLFRDNSGEYDVTTKRRADLALPACWTELCCKKIKFTVED